MSARYTLLRILCLALLLSLSPVLRAQSSGTIGFRRLSVDDGLSQSAVMCIAQDQEGFFWFGTQDGLNKYDGYAFTVFRRIPGDTSSLSDNYITSLLADTNGTLWIGTYSGGVNRLHLRSGTIRRYRLRSDSLVSRGSNSVQSLAKAPSGGLWVATWGGGLDRLDPQTGTWTHVRHETGHDSSLAGERATAIALDRNGSLWLGTWDGLHRYDPAGGFLKRCPATPASSIEEKKIMSVYAGSDGAIWYGTFAAGLFRLDPESSSLSRYTTTGAEGQRLSSMSVRSITEDAQGRLWIGTWEGGIDLLDRRTDRIEVLRSGPPPALGANQVFCLLRDRRQGLWAGTDGGGVNHYDAARFKFRHLRYEPGNPGALSKPIVRALCEDRTGHVWVGLEEGFLNCLDTRTGELVSGRLPNVSSRPAGTRTILAILEDSDGYLWVGTDGEGLHRLDPSRKSWRAIRFPRGRDEIVGPDHVIALNETKDGALWIGTLGGGLIRMDRHSLEQTRYMRTSRTASNQLTGNYVYSLMEDRAGRIWVGTWGAGISVLDPRAGSFKTYQHDEADPHSLAQNSVLAFHEDARGIIWAATLGGGLDAFDPSTETFAHVTEADGLPNNVINGILEDSAGNLWLSTNRGVCRFNPAARSFRNYDVGDGLQSMEFNQGAFCGGRDGAMYFGGINGLNTFRPATLPLDSLPPPVRITRCAVFDRPLTIPDQSRGLELSYDQNFISFEFTALDFTAPEKNTYRYMMEGVDRDWVSCGTRRYASYTSLPGGDYVFRVRASNSDGVWNLTGTALVIHVAPPIWETAWFRVLALALLLGSLVAVYRRRIRQLERERRLQSEFSRKLNESQETERKRVAGELHDGLGQELLTVKNTLARIAEDQPPSARGRLVEVENAVQRAIEDVRHISADLHPHMLERLGLTRTIESTIRRISDAACLKIVSSVEPIDGLLQPSEEIDFYRIIQEALTNVVKHSNASQCSVQVKRAPSQIHLMVQDDGRGFEPDAVATSETAGLGLVNMAERVRLLRGDMEIRSAPGSGSTLLFHFPISESGSHNRSLHHQG